MVNVSFAVPKLEAIFGRHRKEEKDILAYFKVRSFMLADILMDMFA